MSERSRPRRSATRYLAPLALATIIAATYLVIHDTLDTSASHSAGHVSRRPAQPKTVTHATHGHSQGRAGAAGAAVFYVVRPGDTLSVIAGRTGVALTTLEHLNPGVSSTSLQVGQRLRLRR